MCNTELEKFFSWTAANKLSINFGRDKTYYILHTFNRNLDTNDLNININNHILESFEHEKFLGVIIDSKLKYHHHIDHIAKKISKSIGIIYKLSKLKMPSCTLKQLYYNLIYSHLNYNVCSYGSTYNTHINRLYLLQKKAIRIINNAPFLAHTDPLFRSCKILKIHDIFKLNVGMYMYDHGLSGQYSRVHEHDTRHHDDLIPDQIRLSVCQNSLSVVGPNIWNSIPSEIQISPSRKSFKFRYKDYLLSFYDE